MQTNLKSLAQTSGLSMHNVRQNASEKLKVAQQNKSPYLLALVRVRIEAESVVFCEMIKATRSIAIKHGKK